MRTSETCITVNKVIEYLQTLLADGFSDDVKEAISEAIRHLKYLRDGPL